MAETAEEVGFASLWLGDHFLYRRKDEDLGPWECWSMLAALAAVTDRVLLGPLVSPTGFRNPAVLAKMAATVDEISGGRLVLGLGSGWNEREFEAAPFRIAVGPSRLRSCFLQSIDADATGLRVRGRGWGHGVGLCQIGAKTLAEDALLAEDILRTYYPGVQVVRLW